MPYSFKQIEAHDPNNPGLVAPNAMVTIFEPGDPAMTPLTLTTLTGEALANPVKVNGLGYGPAFMHATLSQVAWAGGGLTGTFESYHGMRDEAIAARAAAESAVAQAENAATTAQTAAQAPTDEAVDAGIARANLPALAAAAAAADETVAAAATSAVATAVTGLKIRQIIEHGPTVVGTNHTLTVDSGTPTFTSGNAKFGSGGLAGGILASTTADAYFHAAGVGNVTVEAWFKTTATDLRVLFTHTSFWWLGIEGGIAKLNYNTVPNHTGLSITGGTNLNNGAWHHAAVVWNASRVPSVYVDGALVVAGTTAMAEKSSGNNEPFRVGGLIGTVPGYNWPGAIDELRLSNVARYSGSTYTTPTEAFVPDGNTKLLAHFTDPIAVTYGPGVGYPPRPAGTNVRVEWVGPSLPPEMAVGDTWIEVPA